ncbi:MAG TPA: neutral/alkaline non-lysosomal ceramidase N-terminal domain-containing protein [Armatimonadota bacterium]|nr:neutral/alkaline non-lysosomal ceramidase N-terminal domain-containing protein [Armatimonadota bacterium]
MMLAGTAKIDITPTREVWMDGMIRSHRSEGVHDPLFARALVLANSREPRDMFAIVSVDVCLLSAADSGASRQGVAGQVGIPTQQTIIATTHTHSGPATIGHFNPPEAEYSHGLAQRLAALVAQAAGNLEPVAVGVASGREDTISHYRRLLADDGHVVMNWEPYPPEHIVGPLGEADTEVGVLKVTAAEDPQQVKCILFNHAGHPNIMSGDNYLLSADYPGAAARLLEQEWGALAMFVNGAQGTMDIDGLRHRDWEGLERAGAALAQAVSETARAAVPTPDVRLRSGAVGYTVPARTITDEEWAWAQEILRRSGGKVQPLADGVGDDYLAVLYRDLRRVQGQEVPIEQICLAVGDAAFITFPGELYTEIGMQIKARSRFARTYIIGLANGEVGYVPTRKAISEGGYAENVRRLDDAAEEIVVGRSLALLETMHGSSPEE